MERQELAQRIKLLREKKKMTQNALANAAGVSPTYIYQLEKGESSPTVEYLEHICWGLGIAIEDFFLMGRSESKTNESQLDRLTVEQKDKLNEFLRSLI